MKLIYDDFKLQPCPAVEWPPPGLCLGEALIIRLPDNKRAACNILTDHQTAWAHVAYRGVARLFWVLTPDGDPYIEMDKESGNRRARDIAGDFADHVDHHGGEAPTF